MRDSPPIPQRTFLCSAPVPMKFPLLFLCSMLPFLVLFSVAREPEAGSGGNVAATTLEEVVVTGKRSDLLGIAPAASEGTA
ncbi:MAG: hypothetical protein RLZZ142_167, partial [Verrucomicrobiota bacterium]